MKQPSLEEVKEYFKNAKTLKSYIGCIFELGNIVKGVDMSFKNAETGDTLYNDETGEYAEILSYKEKTFSITESQIKEVNEFLLMHKSKESSDKLKEWFPEAFESEVKELKTGNWYKHKHEKEFITFVKNDGRRYGIGTNGKWFQDAPEVNDATAYYEATEQEVFEALKNEAVKRGYKDGTWLKKSGINKMMHQELKICGEFEYYPFSNVLDCQDGNGHIFEKGQWAEIIPTITLSEAEQQLKKKIIV